MKKIFLITVILLSSFATAQDIVYGIKGGVNFANQLYTFNGTTKQANNITDFNLGIYFQFPISKKIYFKPEIIYSQEGSWRKASYSGFDLNPTERLSYINIPLMIKTNLSESINFEIGPQLGILTKAKEVYDTPYGKESKDVTTQFNQNVFSINAGIAIDLSDYLSLVGRYSYGFTDAINIQNQLQLKNTVISVSAEFRLR